MNPAQIQHRIRENLGFRVDVEELAHPDGRVLVFHVPGRPFGTAYQLDGAYLMRSGEETVPMTEDRLRSIFAEGQPGWLASIAKAGVSPQELIQRLDTQGFFDLIRLPYPVRRMRVIEQLVESGVVRAAAGTWDITNLGALLFAKDLATFTAPRYRAPRVIVYEGPGKIETRLDRQFDRGYAVGFNQMIQFIDGLLPAREVIGLARRREVRAYPPAAVREMVANALIHQDFTVNGTCMIEIFDGRVEVSNPGRAMIAPDRFIDGYQARNKTLAGLMRRMEFCEEKGSGVDKIVRSVEEYELPAPEFRVDDYRTTVILRGPQPFRLMTRGDRIRACYQHCSLCYVRGGKMNNRSLRERFGLPPTKTVSISQVIAASLRAGKIKADGTSESRRHAHYLPYWA